MKTPINQNSSSLYYIYFNSWTNTSIPDEVVKETEAAYADRPEEERYMSWIDFIQEYGFLPDGRAPMSFDEFVETELDVYELARDVYEFLNEQERGLAHEDKTSFVQVPFAEGVVELVRVIDDEDIELDNVINSYIEALEYETYDCGDAFVDAHQLRDCIDAYRGDLSDEKIEERELFYRAYFNGIDNPENYNRVYEPVVKMVCRQLCEWVDPQKCENIMAHSPLGARGTQWAADTDFRRAVLDEAVSKLNKPKEIER